MTLSISGRPAIGSPNGNAARSRASAPWREPRAVLNSRSRGTGAHPTRQRAFTLPKAVPTSRNSPPVHVTSRHKRVEAGQRVPWPSGAGLQVLGQRAVHAPPGVLGTGRVVVGGAVGAGEAVAGARSSSWPISTCTSSRSGDWALPRSGTRATARSEPPRPTASSATRSGPTSPAGSSRPPASALVRGSCPGHAPAASGYERSYVPSTVTVDPENRTRQCRLTHGQPDVTGSTSGESAAARAVALVTRLR